GRARPLDGVTRAELARLATGACVVALDVPSGLDADTGEGEALPADLTVAFGALKPAHLLAAGRCGRVVVADLGLDLSAARTFACGPPQALTPAASAHKYSRGAVLVLGGAAGHGGAARLAAHATVRAGAGLALVACPSGAVAENAARLDAIMVAVADDGAAVAALLARQRFAAGVAGPGLAADDPRLGAMLASGLPLVLDAGVFTMFAGDAAGLAASLTAPAVLTPHEGEFARLFGEMPGGRLDRVRAAAARTGAVVLLKGPATVIAGPDGRAAINAHATPWLATAGSGDVLSGVIAALLAQEFDAFDAACAGAWLHGDAGRQGGAGLTADDLPALVAAAVAAL
ncbi:MAG: NAD(P)H-hydrate dehydratase, partial [Sphingomonadaceae bacterium]|nr:NAD(P)H-hydrate dehydratase [Sphingomonadaceae bacterium]